MGYLKNVSYKKYEKILKNTLHLYLSNDVSFIILPFV